MRGTPSPKQNRKRDRPYLNSFEGRDCEACGTNDGTTVPAHVRWGMEGGTALKPGDDLVVALCLSCHASEPEDPTHLWMTVFKNMLRNRYEDWGNG